MLPHAGGRPVESPPLAIDAKAFWDSACGLYERAGVASLCLELQDGLFDFNVNLLLLACYKGDRGQQLELTHWQLIHARIGPWQNQMMQPLRTVRRESKAWDPALYQQLKKAELAAERLEQTLILTVLTDQTLAQGATVEDNLQTLATSLGAQDDPSVQRRLRRLTELAA